MLLATLFCGCLYLFVPIPKEGVAFIIFIVLAHRVGGIRVDNRRSAVTWAFFLPCLTCR